MVPPNCPVMVSSFVEHVLTVLPSVDFQVTSKPQMIDEVDRRLIQLEMEKLSLRKETRADALKRVEQIDEEMSELQEKQVSKHPFFIPFFFPLQKVLAPMCD